MAPSAGPTTTTATENIESNSGERGINGVSGGSGGASVSSGGGMVLLNGDDVLADMPAGNLVTDDISIPVAM